ncbi:MAG: flavin reductase family protein [Firmicutes bacterium]|nr:flavin reductase family protein [Bacillota bacterium]
MKKSLGATAIAYPTPAWVVGTFDKGGKPNGATVAWGGICCSKPPCVAVSLRKATQSYVNIVGRQAFTINIPSAIHVQAVDYFGLVSGKNTNKFAKTGLTPVTSELVDAPYIEEFPIVLECKLRQSVEIGSHTQFIGEIVDVKIDEDLLGEKGTPDIDKIKPVVFCPPVSGRYHIVGSFLGPAFSIGKELQ